MRVDVSGVSLLLLSSLFFSCNNITGNIDVFNPLNYKNKSGDAVIPVGTYDGELAFKDEQSFKIKFKTKGSDERKYEIKIQSDKKINFPKYVGNIEIRGEDIDQSFDLIGEVDTETTYGEVVYMTESCSKIRTVRDCWRDPNGNIQCESRDITEYGYKNVSYQNVDTVKKMILNIVDAQTTYATMSSTDYSSDKQYLDRGYCIVDHRYDSGRPDYGHVDKWPGPAPMK